MRDSDVLGWIEALSGRVGKDKKERISVEFHPLCVQNPPTAQWASTSCCGAHLITLPLPSTTRSNPSGKLGSSKPLTRSGRTTHRNGWPLLSNPHATSKNSSESSDAKLPKLTYNTDPVACVSSHSMQLLSGRRCRLLPAFMEDSLWSGPAASTTATPSPSSSPRIFSSSAGSSSSNVLITTPLEFLAVSAIHPRTLRTSSWLASLE
uniref:Uncharacterized protein n=1 Tax=Oryza punctata TaxID=4537 RepID=A0A0E0LIU4_ORYPU